jgi:AcrR family transcriptional regulator
MHGKSRKRKATPARRTKAPVELNGKAVPRQQRAQATYEMILEVTGKLLEEVGVDRLSTNLVCQRAGLTPPALYRYFPNKYALLRELGARLMQAQDDAVFEHIAAAATSFGTVEEEARRNREILTRVNAITRKFPGGAWVMRALRAVPALSAVRVKSREEVAERLYKRMRKAFPGADRKNLRTAATLTVEVMYAATELVMNQPELDAARITAEVASMVALYRASFGDPLRKSHLPVR